VLCALCVARCALCIQNTQLAPKKPPFAGNLIYEYSDASTFAALIALL